MIRQRAWEWVTNVDLPSNPIKENVSYNDAFDTQRLAVPGGWLYRVDVGDGTQAAMCFVPDLCTTYRYPGEKT